MYNLIVTSENYSEFSNSKKRLIVEKLDEIYVKEGNLLINEEVVSQGYTYSLDDRIGWNGMGKFILLCQPQQSQTHLLCPLVIL